MNSQSIINDFLQINALSEGQRGRARVRGKMVRGNRRKRTRGEGEMRERRNVRDGGRESERGERRETE